MESELTEKNGLEGIRYKKSTLYLKKIFPDDDIGEIITEKFVRQKFQACRDALLRYFPPEISEIISKKVTDFRIGSKLLQIDIHEKIVEFEKQMRGPDLWYIRISPPSIVLGYLSIGPFEKEKASLFKKPKIYRYKGGSFFYYRYPTPLFVRGTFSVRSLDSRVRVDFTPKTKICDIGDYITFDGRRIKGGVIGD